MDIVAPKVRKGATDDGQCRLQFRKKLGPRGVPGAPDKAKMTPQEEKVVATNGAAVIGWRKAYASGGRVKGFITEVMELDE